jgi:hypothetical protein
MIKAGRFPAGLSSEAYFERMHISCGRPGEVAERLATGRVLPLAADLIVQFSPAAPALDAAIAGLQFWDNRAAVHYAVRNYGEFPRLLERILIADAPQYADL